MNLNSYPYVPKYIVLRKYKDYNIYDLKNDESYIVDEEAYELLKFSNGLRTVSQIIDNFPKNNKKDLLDGIEQFESLGIIQLGSSKILSKEKKTIEHINIHKENPLNPPYLKNLMINITERCNLSCKHCYITEKNKIDMPLKNLMSLIDDFYLYQGIRLILTGGEPLLYSQFKELLTKLTLIPLQKVILTNGVLISEMEEESLNLLKNNYFEVFVSIDGLEKSHNDFRNANCFNATIKGIKTLLNNDITVSVNTMVHKQNLDEFEGIYKIISDLGKIRNWSIDIPTFDEETPKKIREKYEISYEEGGEVLKNYGWGVIYESPSEGEEVDYACGPYLMAVDVIGNITKCGFNFYDESFGNVFKLGLKKSWELIQKNLNWSIQDLECAKIECEYLDECRGGCRYRALQHTGDIHGIDSFKCYQFGKLKN
ncbi:MAG: radical SAM protein [Promethearchaeota archaeon]|nr:MAG: radical SAM protein [Candidatus Lokiarchaeota archaeon]